MKHFFSLTLFLSAALSLSAMSVQQVEPLSWWVGMNTPLTLMVHGEDLADAVMNFRFEKK